MYVTREGELQLAGQEASETLALTILGYAHLARSGELESPSVVKGATERFPPPRFLFDADTSRLYIAAMSTRRAELPGPGFLPFDDYVDERAELFVAAFRNAH